ncbi:MAG: type 1 glutamine amidotransferase domain-containing protein [Bdellovibrio sp.]|nr:type 1 glutamine amidotransferase domain-containing protein [Bdellovibrio sp.]
MKSKRVLFVLTNTERLGDSGHKTGAFLSEITHPYEEISNAGYEIDMVSPLGGEVPLDGVKMDDPINATWMNDEDFLEKLEKTLKPEQINAHDYCAIYFAGGHGAMFDLPGNRSLQHITAEIWENDGVVAAVCHGSAGLVNVKLSDGSFLVAGHEVSSFTNAEEEAVGMENVVPFLLQSRLQERGGLHTESSKFAPHIVRSGRLVTGQNPASAAGVGQAIVEVLEFLNEGRILPEQNWCEWHAQPSAH